MGVMKDLLDDDAEQDATTMLAEYLGVDQSTLEEMDYKTVLIQNETIVFVEFADGTPKSFWRP